MAVSFALKVYSAEGDIDCEIINVPTHDDFTFGKLCRAVHGLVPEADLTKLKWEDADGDLIKLQSDNNLKAAMKCLHRMKNGSEALKIHVVCSPVIQMNSSQPNALLVERDDQPLAAAAVNQSVAAEAATAHRKRTVVTITAAQNAGPAGLTGTGSVLTPHSMPANRGMAANSSEVAACAEVAAFCEVDSASLAASDGHVVAQLPKRRKISNVGMEAAHQKSVVSKSAHTGAAAGSGDVVDPAGNGLDVGTGTRIRKPTNRYAPSITVPRPSADASAIEEFKQKLITLDKRLWTNSMCGGAGTGTSCVLAKWEPRVKRAKSVKALVSPMIEMQECVPEKFLSGKMSLTKWQQDVRRATSVRQLSELLEQFASTINWNKRDKNPTCRICRVRGNVGLDGVYGERLLLCQGCNGSYHFKCLTPPMKMAPEGEWFCENCPLEAAKPSSSGHAVKEEDSESEEGSSMTGVN